MNKIPRLLLILLFCTSCGKYDKGADDFDAAKWAQPASDIFYKGTTLMFADFLQDRGVVYQENGIPKDPYQSVKDHGGNITRLAVNVDIPEVISEQVGYKLDMESWDCVKKQMEHARRVGLDVLLTFHMASNNGEALPLSWKAKNLSQEALGDTVYRWIYDKLDWLGRNDMLPPIVSIGNETNYTFCYDEMYGPDATAHGVKMLNRGYDAVDDINRKYGTRVKKLLHFHNPIDMTWSMSNFVDTYGLSNFDIVGISWYYVENGMGSWQSFGQIGKWLWLKYRKQFMILEASTLFTAENGDNYINIGPVPVPGYDRTPADQRRWFENLAQDVADGGGLGVICWGGEWVGNDAYVYPDFKGSSWDDKAFWTSEIGSNVHELHEGIDWMMKNYKPKK